MKIVGYLQLAPKGGSRGAITAVTSKVPMVQRGTLLLKLVLDLPDDAFRTFIPEAVVRVEPGVNAAYVVANAEMPEGVEGAGE